MDILNLDNAFRNGLSDRLVYVELSGQGYDDKTRCYYEIKFKQ